MPPEARSLLLVDGYNVIGRDAELRQRKARSLRAARQALAALVSGWASSHPGQDCCIVFDGSDAAAAPGQEASFAGVRCVYTRTRTEADDEIIRLVRESRDPRSVTVVSDDNHVSNNCRAHGARVEPASFFRREQGRRATRLGAPPSPGEKSLGRKAVSDINEEQRRRFGL